MTGRRKKFLLAACGVVAVVGVCFFCLRDNEPSYNGRTLSEWLDECEELGFQEIADMPKLKDAVTAVRAIGTNALPRLLAWEAKDESPSQKWLGRHIPSPLKQPWLEKLISGDAAHKNMIAEIGFQILGTNALPALPQLEERFTKGTNGTQVLGSAYAMAYMGRNAFDFCLRTAESGGTNLHVRAAIVAIGQMNYLGTNAMRAMPVLLNAMKNTNDLRVARAATLSASGLGLMPERVLPAATNLFQLGDASTKANVLLGIRFLSKHVAIPRDFLQQALTDPDQAVRGFATNATREAAPEMLTNSVPAR